MRARDLGIEIGTGTPGQFNAITDVPGVEVGHCTLVAGSGPLVRGEGPVRTGVTVLLPARDVGARPVYAGCHRFNGNGELTGLEWVRESGLLTTPIGLTNTHSVGVVRDALVRLDVERRPDGAACWSLPVVGETWDGVLNDINGFHVREEHVRTALTAATSGPVAEGGVGSGTGMICHGFKGGIGTASRLVAIGNLRYTVGVLVQANHGRRDRLTVAGVPVGRHLDAAEVPLPLPPPVLPPPPGNPPAPGNPPESGNPPPPGNPPAPGNPPQGAGSIIVVVGTDAPLLPHQCDRLAQRAVLGIGRVGGAGENSSGDLVIAFATGNRPDAPEVGARLTQDLTMLSDAYLDPMFYATIEATEEAIVNALVAAETMTGRDGNTAHALPHDRLRALIAGA